MNRLSKAILGAASALAIMVSMGHAHADDLNDWCTQVQKASSLVICSDVELRQQAIARNRLFDLARQIMTPDAVKSLTEGQNRWVREYTARCGVSIDGPLPSWPVPPQVVECYRAESRVRTAHLSQIISRAGGTPLPVPPQNDEQKRDYLERLYQARKAEQERQAETRRIEQERQAAADLAEKQRQEVENVVKRIANAANGSLSSWQIWVIA